MDKCQQSSLLNSALQIWRCIHDIRTQSRMNELNVFLNPGSTVDLSVSKTKQNKTPLSGHNTQLGPDAN